MGRSYSMLYPLLLLCIVSAISAGSSCKRSKGHDVCKIGNKVISYATGKPAKCKKACKHGKKACNRLCKKCKTLCAPKPPPAPPAPPAPPRFQMPGLCKLDKDEGDGNETHLRSYFSFNTTFNNNTCQLFWYTGKGGNENRFNTVQECWKTCAPDKAPKGGYCHKKEDDNRLGACTWYWGYRYDAASNDCYFVKTDGCFRRKNECREKCVAKRVPLPPPPPPPPIKYYKIKKGKVKCCFGKTKAKCATHNNNRKCKALLLKKYGFTK